MEVTAYQLKISLVGMGTPIWRRVVVLSNMSFENLAMAINDVMGWGHFHLHVFEIGKEEFGPVDSDGDDYWEDERLLKIKDVVGRFKKFRYIYDLGDSWQHEVVIEKEIQAMSNTKYPYCVDGKGTCPEEDSRGSEIDLARLKSSFDAKFANMKLMQKIVPKNIQIRQLQV